MLFHCLILLKKRTIREFIIAFFSVFYNKYFQVYILFINLKKNTAMPDAALLTKKSANIDENAEFPQKPCLIPVVCIY